MPIYRKFEELPLTAIHPEGWLRSYLEKQSRGLTGHLEKAGFPFNTAGWASQKLGTAVSVSHGGFMNRPDTGLMG